MKQITLLKLSLIKYMAVIAVAIPIFSIMVSYLVWMPTSDQEQFNLILKGSEFGKFVIGTWVTMFMVLIGVLIFLLIGNLSGVLDIIKELRKTMSENGQL